VANKLTAAIHRVYSMFEKKNTAGFCFLYSMAEE